jgi:hypothetical protein
MTLPALIEQLERAAEGSRELDAEIMFDLYAKPVGQHKDDGGPIGYNIPNDQPSWNLGVRFPGKDRAWFTEVRKRNKGETIVIERDGALVLMNSIRIPKLTTTLDAAMTLVPADGWLQYLGQNLAGWQCRVERQGVSEMAKNRPTAPLAICLAALKSRLPAGGGEWWCGAVFQTERERSSE